jgi:nitric oxide reductase subunit B
MIILTMTSYAMPIMRGRPNGNSPEAQKVERWAFWLMVIGMLGMTLMMVVAGFEQILLQRWPESGFALDFMSTQVELISTYKVRLVFGALFSFGLVAYFVSFFVKGTLPNEAKVINT